MMWNWPDETDIHGIDQRDGLSAYQAQVSWSASEHPSLLQSLQGDSVQIKKDKPFSTKHVAIFA